MTARMLVSGKRRRLVARVCNYSDEPYELKKDSFLAHAEPVECLPGSREELPKELCIGRRNNMLSVSTGASEKTDLRPATEQNPVDAQRTTTVSEGTTAAGADAPAADATAAAETLPSTDKPTADDPRGHIQCLVDGLPDDLTDEQHARATAFIRSQSNVFSRSEYDIGRTRIIPHSIDTGDNAPHFEQLRRHPTTQLPMIDEHVEHMLAHDVIEPAASLWS